MLRSLLRVGLFLVATSMVMALPFRGPTRIVAFGDSLTDMGNTSSLTFGFTPGSAYFQGRFSNGPVWIERLAGRFGLSITRSRSGGYNYAHGGAETGSGNSSVIIPNVSSQVTSYLNARNPAPGELFVLWAGGNDLLNGQTNVNVPVANLEADIVRLYQRGARWFVIPNLPLLGYTPRHVGTPDEAIMNARSTAFNNQLRNRLIVLGRTLPGIRIHQVLVSRFMVDVRNRPDYYGFSNVTQPAYNGTTTVPNPNSYAFFDEIHPTARAHELLGDYATLVVAGRG